MHGVSLSAVFNQDGIFSRAENATGKYGKAKARETLEIAFSALQMEKHERGLKIEALDTRITEEINKMSGEEIGDDKTEVIVDGYRFTIDRTVPKIVEELGVADGVVISASVRGLSNGWMKPSDVANISVTGIIKTYSGGTITTYSATKGGTAISGFSIDAEGRYTINNITENTTIEIIAKDSNKKEKSKIIPITIKIDGTAPTVETVTAEANGMDIIISATGHDKNGETEESGIDKFHYTITPTDGVSKASGEFGINEKPKITTTVETTYTINVTATDKVGNGPSAQKSTTVTTEIPFGEKDTVKKTASDGEWWIPKGFVESSDSSSTIQGGKVIEDKNGNQWVWIPCYLNDNGATLGLTQYNKATKYERTAFKGEDIISTYTEALDEIDEMSIKNYGGFYIGRYEAGRVGTDTVVIKRSQTPYHSIALVDCKTKSTNFAKQNKYDESKVYTKLVSSYGWDTALSFIAVTNSSYPTNSTQGIYGQRNYKNTGSSTAVCNIYDMGGNLWEYTSESYSYGSIPYVARGGNYGSSASDHPAGLRTSHNGAASSVVGFRPLLYIK